MKQDADGLYTDFCCVALEYHTKHPEMCVKFDPFYKKFDNEEGEHRACVFTLPTGRAQTGTKTSDAGRGMIAINFCPWCASKIVFE